MKLLTVILNTHDWTKERWEIQNWSVQENGNTQWENFLYAIGRSEIFFCVSHSMYDLRWLVWEDEKTGRIGQYIGFSVPCWVAFMGVSIVVPSWYSIYWTFKNFAQPTHVFKYWQTKILVPALHNKFIKNQTKRNAYIWGFICIQSQLWEEVRRTI